LASRAIEAAFNLLFGSLAMWAVVHGERHNIISADLDSPLTREKVSNIFPRQ
jgi:hypothetical protein